MSLPSLMEVSSMTCEQLVLYLEERDFGPSVLDVVRAERIDGKMFSQITTQEKFCELFPAASCYQLLRFNSHNPVKWPPYDLPPPPPPPPAPSPFPAPPPLNAAVFFFFLITRPRFCPLTRLEPWSQPDGRNLPFGKREPAFKRTGGDLLPRMARGQLV